MERVEAVWPPMAAPFLVQVNVRALVFSVSLSASEKTPALQVNVSANLGEEGVMDGAPNVGLRLGKALDAVEVVTLEPEESLKVMLMLGVDGVSEEQLKRTVKWVVLVELLNWTQEPELVLMETVLMSVPPSASLAVALA